MNCHHIDSVFTLGIVNPFDTAEKVRDTASPFFSYLFKGHLRDSGN